jgi:integrase
LPVVLTRDEVRRILGKMNGTNRIIATLLYGSGMRLLECLRLHTGLSSRLENSWPPFA